MYIIYDFVFLLYALVYLPYLLLTNRGYAGFGMRFGLFFSKLKEQIKGKANIWLHAVSVGEVLALEGFIDQLRVAYPAYQLIVTVTTKTGFKLAQERFKNKALVLASPLDLSFVTANFISLIVPKIYVAVETEIWPNLFRQLSRKQIPLIIINGRISDNSYGRYKSIRLMLKGILNQVTLWCMQSQNHANRIIDLGAQASKVVVVGNIKFDQIAARALDSFEFLKGQCWWVAGSTHPGEEELVLNVYKKMMKDNPQWRLIIAPRHIERAGEILNLINHIGFKAVRLSEKVIDADSVIVVDTIGDLRSLYALASLVFVGKSLCGHGGQNIIEPAFLGKPVVVGPHTENFKDIIAAFKEKNAIIEVDGPDSFETAIRQLSQDASRREQLGMAAQKVVTAHQGATKRNVQALARFLK